MSGSGGGGGVLVVTAAIDHVSFRMLNPKRDKNGKSRYRMGKTGGSKTPVTTACPEDR